MLLKLIPGWSAEVDHCHEWVCLRLFAPAGETSANRLANSIRRFLQTELIDRLVIEMDQVRQLSGRLLRQLIQLAEDLASQGGSLRLAGLSEDCYQSVRRLSLESRFPRYHDRSQALDGHRPGRPR